MPCACFIFKGFFNRKDLFTVVMVIVRKSELLDKALKRFKKKVDKEGIMRSLRERQHYEKPSNIRRKKRNAVKSKMRRDSLRQY